jgi:hypothetical protein
LENERAELSKKIERLKEKLDKAESLIYSMGTPEAIRQRGPVMGTSAEMIITRSGHQIALNRTLLNPLI